jgi:acyl-coenzyme A synthetase/AMP-(fatty) acid ligase
MWKCFPFEAAEICCQKTSLSFVDSVWELFGPLLQGIRVVLIADEVLKDSQRLIARLRREQITRIVLVPSLLRFLLNTESDLENQLPHLKYWTSSGEALSVDLAVSFLNRLPQRVLLNLYGSSEVAADATCYDMGDWKELSCVPIGRPIANTQVYLLDSVWQLVPIGVPGEVYIGGANLARGYWQRADLTAERFLPHPWSQEPGARFYRTGDLARALPDGTLEFLGRLDQQVKIRGYRIELSEIEAVLMKHPAIKEAVVLAREGASGLTPEEEKRLVAYLVGEGSNVEMTGDLRSYLQEQLPSYMIPTSFVWLDTLPLSPNGKVDRKALPVPNRSQLLETTEMVAPQTPLQEQLAMIWAELLFGDHRDYPQPYKPQVGIHDNFFELGGHSLLATQLMARLRTVFQIEMPLRRLFEKPTIAEMALAIKQIQSEQIAQSESEELAQMLTALGGLSEEKMQAIFTD